MCSCGRSEVEFGCDLCSYCHADEEERQTQREQEAAFNADQQARYDAWLDARAPEAGSSEARATITEESYGA